MRNGLLSSFLVTMALTSGCASKPKLALEMKMPDVPAETTETIAVQIEFPPQRTLKENVSQMDGHLVRKGSTIVINVPSVETKRIEASKERESGFKTMEFFHVAEQQIERVLIGKGFRVVSRSKLEAKLRDLRDDNKRNWWHSDPLSLRSRLPEELRPLFDNLKQKLDSRQISNEQFQQDVSDLMEKAPGNSAGRSRTEGEKELTDISEVIRAAQSGDVQAHYILQINQFDPEKKDYLRSDLRANAAVRSFLSKYPALRSEIEKGGHEIRCAATSAVLNAKLIHVQSGEIVWIGHHEVNEFDSGIENATFELGQKTLVDNLWQIQNFINNQNTYQEKINRFGKPEPKTPSWTYTTKLIPPMLIAGRCNREWQKDETTSTKIARKVADQLIGEIITAPAPTTEAMYEPKAAK